MSPPQPPPIFCPVLWGDLADLEPKLVEWLAGVELIRQGYSINFLGQEHLVDLSQRQVVGPPSLLPVGFVKTMIVLTYLAKSALGPAPGLAETQVGVMEIPGGSLFFRGPHALPEDKLIQAFGRDPAALTARALELGAKAAPPASFLFRVLPFVELGCYLDQADEEFPAQVRWIFDRHSHYYLALDGLLGLCQVLVGELVGESYNLAGELGP
ncbi:MAG: DUF3786 domain-containing protein [Deltaproteobacteria bacterium]|jgi:hypothetical protein|nr:DUF3786 domain-containing protein [Deltaproteobacteria bacterium]